MTSTAPLLAVEYADTGQNEVTSRQEIIELLRAGTKYICLTLRNLVQRKGYAGLDDVKLQSRLAEARNAVRRVLARRKLHLSASDNARIDACSNLETLERWLDNPVDAPSTCLAVE